MENNKQETKTDISEKNEENELLAVLQSSLYPGASFESIKMVLGYCKAAGLDPMQKPVHIVPMWDKGQKKYREVIMPGIGMYRVQAFRAGCAGISEPEFGPEVTENLGGVDITYPSCCRVTVKRILSNGQVAEFTAKEFWKENYAEKGGTEKSIAPNQMWGKRIYAQLAKCTEAQALRKAFPESCSLPTADEMEGKTLEGEVLNSYKDEQKPQTQNTSQAQKSLPFYQNEKLDEMLLQWGPKVEEGKLSAEKIISKVSASFSLTQEQIDRINDLEKTVAGA